MSLNIEFNTRANVIRALTRNTTIKEAAYDLGISERQLYKLRSRYLVYRSQDGSWYHQDSYFTRKITGTLKQN